MKFPSSKATACPSQQSTGRAAASTPLPSSARRRPPHPCPIAKPQGYGIGWLLGGLRGWGGERGWKWPKSRLKRIESHLVETSGNITRQSQAHGVFVYFLFCLEFKTFSMILRYPPAIKHGKGKGKPPIHSQMNFQFEALFKRISWDFPMPCGHTPADSMGLLYSVQRSPPFMARHLCCMLKGMTALRHCGKHDFLEASAHHGARHVGAYK